MRKGEPFAQFAARFGVGTATVWRYVDETVALLAARAPYIILDGTLGPIDRGCRGPTLLLRQAPPARDELHIIASPGSSAMNRAIAIARPDCSTWSTGR